MRHKTVAIIGHFGGNETFLDGQTVKTRTLYEELTQATDWRILRVDTYDRQKHPVRFLRRTAAALLSTRDVIVLLSGNGMRVCFPVLYAAVRRLHTRVYHDVIGGNLDAYMRAKPSFAKYLNSFRVNWVETERLRQELEVLGVKNCQVVPNFKRLTCIQPEAVVLDAGPVYRFCTFSRVMREKGIETAVEAVETINRDAGRLLCSLDVYGPVEPTYRAEFERLLQDAFSAVRYRGAIPYGESVEAIRGYYGLLFPTFWKGEGFPGTLVDAFSAGVPVIASDWMANSEIVEHEKTGLLYPRPGMETLQEAMRFYIQRPQLRQEMGRRCIQRAQEYRPEPHILRMIQQIEEAKI
jgi:glycosyltransferase involved in cell wall biosynthesis